MNQTLFGVTQRGLLMVLGLLACGTFAAEPPATRPMTNPWGVKDVLAGEAGQPRVLLIGDSILNGYHTQAAALLKGKVGLDIFVTPKHVGGIAADLKGVLGQKSYDLIFFNDIGLHAWQPGRIAEGKYEPLLRAHIARLRELAPKAKLIFATTTPILTKTKPFAIDAEKNDVIVERNTIARRVMEENQIPVADFYAALSPKLELSAGDAFHWTRPAYAVIAQMAVNQIADALHLTLPSTQPAGDSAPPAATHTMEVRKESAGALPDGTEIERFVMSNGRGLEASVMTLGATLTSVRFPDRQGNLAELTLSSGTPAQHLKDLWVTGSVIGRYANRIAGARFSIDGVSYELEANSRKHHIHGGSKSGYAALVWKAAPSREADAVGVELSLTSPDGQGGYPGTVQIKMTYKVTAANELVMDYQGTTDKPTHLNLTNHAYWNLAGADGKNMVMDHVMQIDAAQYLPADVDLIPTGEIASVEGTPLDFRTARAVGSPTGGWPRKFYDDCYVVQRKAGEGLVRAARVTEPGSGRVMEVWTTQPGVQFFTGNPHGLCLETQHYPNSPNQPNFPTTLLRPGEAYHERTVHRFSVGRQSKLSSGKAELGR